ncbi:MAG: UDP-galactopyranose mutase [Kosmotogaceae bacterium]
MKWNIIVVGAGLAGSTAARLLAERGNTVLVIERLNHIAGHCYDYKDKNGITIHKYGPHIFHTNDENAWNFVNRFSEFEYYQHRVRSYVDGMYVTFPINRDTICQLYGVSIGSKEVRDFLKNEVKDSVFSNPPKNFKDAVISQVGDYLYRKFFEGYTRKQWETDPENLSPGLAKRIPVRTNRDDRYFSDKYQGIPLNGYTTLVRNMLNHNNISILAGADYFEIKDDLSCDLTVYTGELDRFFDYKYGRLQYRSLELKLKTFEKEYYQPVSVVNYPGDYDWTRITEFKHFLKEGQNTNKTTVCFEYPKEEGEPYYIVPTNENIERRTRYMEEVEQLESSRNFLLVGRLAEYKYYNMDQVISAVQKKLSNY